MDVAIGSFLRCSPTRQGTHDNWAYRIGCLLFDRNDTLQNILQWTLPVDGEIIFDPNPPLMVVVMATAPCWESTTEMCEVPSSPVCVVFTCHLPPYAPGALVATSLDVFLPAYASILRGCSEAVQR